MTTQLHGFGVLGRERCIVQRMLDTAMMLVAVLLLSATSASAAGVKIALQADSGQWFARCNDCQKTVNNGEPDTVTVHVKSPRDAPYAQFEIIDVGNGKIALKADTGKFVARCNQCIPGGQPDVLTIHVTDSTPPEYAQFTLEPLQNGRYALKADTGKYVARCNSCSPGATVADTVTVHATNPDTEPWAQWKIVPVFPEGSRISLQSDTGKWFARCNSCQKTVDNGEPDTVTVHYEGAPAGAAYAQFQVVPLKDDRIALKADTGNFVARCNRCIVGGTTPDFVTIHARESAPAWAQFTPVLLPNAKWALQADTGKYVARCNGCSPSCSLDTVTIHSTNPAHEPWAQWKIVVLE